jgi:hypothetical protein
MVLSNLSVNLEDQLLSLEEVSKNLKLTLLCSDVEISADIDSYGGVMSDNGTLICNGDFVKYSDGGTFVSSTKLCELT